MSTILLQQLEDIATYASNLGGSNSTMEMETRIQREYKFDNFS